MKASRVSRRMFLQGVGGASLTIPFLPSLDPTPAFAQSATTGPKNLVIVYTKYGNEFTKWFTNPAPTTPSASGEFKSRALSDISGDLSPILGAPYGGAIRKKLAILRGLDPYCIPMAHNQSFPLTGDAGENGGKILEDKLQWAYSVDVVLEKSKKFYPTQVAIPALRTAGNKSFSYEMLAWSWSHDGGVIKQLDHDWDPKAVYDKVFQGMSGGMVDTARADRQKRLSAATNLIHEDFKRTIDSRRISQNDKVRLDNFMSLLTSIQAKLDAPQVTCSSDPALEARLAQLDGDYGKINDVLFDIEAMALACGTTKIVTHGMASYGPGSSDDDGQHWHDIGHGDDKQFPIKLTAGQWHAKNFADFVERLDALTDADGNTVLDNTVALYVNEDCTGGHFLQDMPVIVAGGKGAINTDLYIDYRNQSDPVVSSPYCDSSGKCHSFFYGRPYNNLLITVLKALGLSEPDYKMYPDKDGFGRYAGGHGADHYTQYVSTPEARNAPLPGLWAAT